MSKLTETSKEIKDFIEDIICNNTTLEHLITWRILSDEKQKELIKISKSSAVTEYFAKMFDSIIIYVNEEIFDAMQPTKPGEIDYRRLVIEDALVNVQIVENENTGNMNIKIAKPNICITTDGYTKYGESLVKAAEVAAMAYDQLKETEKQRKEEEKAKKTAERAAKKNKSNGIF